MLGLNLLSGMDVELYAQGSVAEENGRRLLFVEQSDTVFDLSWYLNFEIERGDDDSATSEELEFSVKVESIRNADEL